MTVCAGNYLNTQAMKFLLVLLRYPGFMLDSQRTPNACCLIPRIRIKNAPGGFYTKKASRNYLLFPELVMPTEFPSYGSKMYLFRCWIRSREARFIGLRLELNLR